jgi:hypothetical protein
VVLSPAFGPVAVPEVMLPEVVVVARPTLGELPVPVVTGATGAVEVASPTFAEPFVPVVTAPPGGTVDVAKPAFGEPGAGALLPVKTPPGVVVVVRPAFTLPVAVGAAAVPEVMPG